MTIDEASKLLELAPGSTPEQIETRFNDLRARLEDRLVKAPTPALKDKYRRSLNEVTKAFETMVHAADGSELPVLQRAEPQRAAPIAVATGGSAGTPSSSTISASPAKKPSGGKEFFVVALIAVLLLAAGGWWIANTRAANAERAAAAERLAEEEVREKERQDSAFARLRAEQAEAKIRWEAFERELQTADRRLSELRSDLRNTRDLPAPRVAELEAQMSAQNAYVGWLQPWVTAHPAKTQLARLDALLSARSVDDASETGAELARALTAAGEELAERRAYFTTLTTIPELGLELVRIRAGSFTMGSPLSEAGRSDYEGPQTRVTISKAFWLGKHEVTQGQWQTVMGNNPSCFKGTDLPVEEVSWEDAMDFCRRLTERERGAGRLPAGYVYTLPTEAQWEYAARAGTTGPYGGNGNLDDMGWYNANSGSQTHPVGGKRANAWGLYDMHGNVSEWCADWFSDSLPGGSMVDPVGPGSGTNRVQRGGGSFFIAEICRSAIRGKTRVVQSRYLGFRLALTPSR